MSSGSTPLCTLDDTETVGVVWLLSLINPLFWEGLAPFSSWTLLGSACRHTEEGVKGVGALLPALRIPGSSPHLNRYQ